MSIRWKITLLCLVAALVPLSYLNHTFVEHFDAFTRRDREMQMANHAFMAGQLYLGEMNRLTATNHASSVAARLSTFQNEFQTRLRILSRNGIVLFDSEEMRSVGQDLSSQKEIRTAISGQYGARSALTPDRQFMFYYIAKPVFSDGTNLVAIAHAERHTGDIIKAILEMTAKSRRTMAISLFAAVAGSVILGVTLTRRLLKLTKSVQSFAAGSTRLETLRPAGRDEIGTLNKAVQQLADEIERRRLLSASLLAETAHELKTPLTAIKGASQILKDTPGTDPGTRGKFLANIEKNADRLIGMVEQLRRLSRIDAEDLRGSRQLVDYPIFVREAVERLKPGLEGPGAEIRLEVPSNNIQVSIRPDLIEQVLANILENAFRLTPADGTITIRVSAKNHQVVTTVEDTGPGIPEGNLQRIFERFFSASPDRRQGIGLAIAKSIVENHGGTIRAFNRPVGGATLEFTI